MQTADFVDNQRESRLSSLDSTESSNVFLANCRKNSTKWTRGKLDSEAISGRCKAL